MFRGKCILVAGGAGSLGGALIEKLLLTECRVIRILDNSERNLYETKHRFNNKRLRWLQGDIRDSGRVAMAMDGVDYVIAAAALKSVDIAEDNVFETIETNICSTLIQEAFRERPSKFLAISSDKALLADDAGVYHATKFLLEKSVLWANKHSEYTKFSCIRPANFIPSEMSVFHTWYNQKKSGKPLTLTSTDASRFFIPLNQAAQCTLDALQFMKGGEIFIPKKQREYSMLALAKRSGSRYRIIDLRRGDREHEVLMTPKERECAKSVGGLWVVR